MATLQKYLFDTDFGDYERPAAVIEEDLLEPEEEIPTFSEEEVEAARQAGFAAGHQQGVSETMQGIESQTSEILGTLSTQLGTLFSRQAENNETLSNDALNLVMSIARRLLPDLNAKNGLGEVTRVSQDLLERLLTEPRIEIRVNESIASQLNDALTPFLDQRGFKGDLVILGETDIGVGECKLDWSSGSADRDIDRLWQGIETAVQESLLTQQAMEEAEPTGEFSGEPELVPASDAVIEPVDTVVDEPGEPAAFASEFVESAAPDEVAAPPTEEPLENVSAPDMSVDERDAVLPETVIDDEDLLAVDAQPADDELPTVAEIDMSEATTSLDLSEPPEPVEVVDDGTPPNDGGEDAAVMVSGMGPPLLEPLDGYDPLSNDDNEPVSVAASNDSDEDPDQNDSPEGEQ